jgi:hypothetical protein
LRRGVFAQFSTRNPGFKLPKRRISPFTGAAIADKRLRGSDWAASDKKRSAALVESKLAFATAPK